MSNQSFQTLYIDDKAKETKDKIVLIEEMYESLPEASGVLSSLFKEKFFGMVIAGSTILLAKFRAKLYDYDSASDIGSLEIAEILKKIIDICYECECEVVYYKGPVVYDAIPEELKNISVSVYLKDTFNSEKIDKRMAAYAIGLKDFNPKKLLEKVIKSGDKEKLDLDLMSLEETKKLMDHVKKNEKDLIELQKAIKESKNINPDNIANEIIHEMDIDKDLQHFLGSKYADLIFYDVLCKEQMTRQLFENCVIEASDSAYADKAIELDKKIQDKKDLIKKLDKSKENSLLEDIDDLEEEKILSERMSGKQAMDILNSVNLGIDKKNKKRIIIATSKKLPQELIKKLSDWSWPEKQGITLKNLENIEWVSGKLSMTEDEIAERKTKIKDKDEEKAIPKKEKIKKEKKKIDPFTKM